MAGRNSVVQDQGVYETGADGKTVYRCTIPNRNGRPCNKILKVTTEGNISTHRRLHNGGSQYKAEIAQFRARKPCVEPGCGRDFGNMSSILSHHRNYHDHRGDKYALFRRYGIYGM